MKSDFSKYRKLRRYKSMKVSLSRYHKSLGVSLVQVVEMENIVDIGYPR